MFARTVLVFMQILRAWKEEESEQDTRMAIEALTATCVCAGKVKRGGPKRWEDYADMKSQVK